MSHSHDKAGKASPVAASDLDQLRTSESQLRSLMQNSVIGMSLATPEGKWLEVNPAFCKLVGYTREEMLSLSFRAITHPEDLEADLERVRQLVSGEANSYQATKRYLHKEGHVVWVQLNVSLVRDSDGAPRHFVAQIQDITKRKRAEKEARWKTAFLEAQIQSSVDGILVLDHRGKRIIQNRRLIEMWRIPQHIADQPDDAAQFEFVLRQVCDPELFIERVNHLNANPHEIGRDEIALVDGRVFDRQAAPVVDKNAMHYGRIWTFRDITARKKSEQELRESQENFPRPFKPAPSACSSPAWPTAPLSRPTRLSPSCTKPPALTSSARPRLTSASGPTRPIAPPRSATPDPPAPSAVGRSPPNCAPAIVLSALSPRTASPSAAKNA